ncbi:type IV pilus assembly protein PilO [Paenibacillus methanolicus]|uniref:Type IV pilus assembly protein PilO n=2 Tax=Paenibacillus methanolicus TaxID=582686 RepID=A0A5S5BWV1_9BACL|nr:type IV pilus assembly protein PilO [Paenibacillus methanolicus]
MEQLSKNRTLFILLFAMLFLILFVLYQYVVMPSSDKLPDQEDEISRLADQQRILERQKEKKSSQDAAYAEESVQKALPLWDNTEQLLLDFKQIESSSNASVVSAAFAVEEAGGSKTAEETAGTEEEAEAATEINAGKVVVNTVLSGRYAEIVSFIDGLQKLPRLTTIDTLDITKSLSNVGGATDISVNLVFTAYFDPSYAQAVEHIVQPYKDYVPEEDAASAITGEVPQKEETEEAKTQDATLGKIVESVEEAKTP